MLTFHSFKGMNVITGPFCTLLVGQTFHLKSHYNTRWLDDLYSVQGVPVNPDQLY